MMCRKYTYLLKKQSKRSPDVSSVTLWLRRSRRKADIGQYIRRQQHYSWRQLFLTPNGTDSASDAHYKFFIYSVSDFQITDMLLCFRKWVFLNSIMYFNSKFHNYVGFYDIFCCINDNSFFFKLWYELEYSVIKRHLIRNQIKQIKDLTNLKSNRKTREAHNCFV